jgi:hypothetical protein
MMVGWYLDQKHGKGLHAGVVGATFFCLGVGIFLTMVRDLSFAQVSLKKEGITREAFGAVMGVSVWRWNEILSFAHIPKETLGKPFSLLVLTLPGGAMVSLGMPEWISRSDVSDFLRAQGVQETASPGAMSSRPSAVSGPSTSALKPSLPAGTGKPQRGPVLLRQKLAIVVFTFTVPVLALDYWKHGGAVTFFGAVPLDMLIAVACLGGAISFVMYAQVREMPWAWIPGAISGFGGFCLHILYTRVFEKESMWDAESIMVAGLGALPGILIYCGVSKILRGNREEPSMAYSQTGVTPK